MLQEVQQRFDCTDEVCLLVHFCRFEFTWPAHSIVITPERGEVPPRYWRTHHYYIVITVLITLSIITVVVIFLLLLLLLLIIIIIVQDFLNLKCLAGSCKQVCACAFFFSRKRGRETGCIFLFEPGILTLKNNIGNSWCSIIWEQSWKVLQ